MKSISYKTLSLFVETSYFLFIFGSIIFAILYIRDLVSEDFEANISFAKVHSNFLVDADSSKIQVISKTDKGAEAFLMAENWKLNFTTNSLLIRTFITSVFVIQVIYFFIILFIVRRFVHSLKAGTPFTLQNVTLIKTVGMMVLLIDPLRWICSYAVRYWIDENFIINYSKSTAYNIGYSIGSGYSWSLILTGLLVLVIAEVFKQGLVIKEEQDLTI